MNDKPRIGRPSFEDGLHRRMIGVRCTDEEFDTVLDGLTSRERMEAMLDKIAAQAAADLWQPFEEQE